MEPAFPGDYWFKPFSQFLALMLGVSVLPVCSNPTAKVAMAADTLGLAALS